MDGLEKDLGRELIVMRLNIHDEDALPILNDLGFRFTPTFILFDGNGSEVWRSIGTLDAEEVKLQINELDQSTAEGM